MVELLERGNLSQRALRQPPALPLHFDPLDGNNLARARVSRLVCEGRMAGRQVGRGSSADGGEERGGTRTDNAIGAFAEAAEALKLADAAA